MWFGNVVTVILEITPTNMHTTSVAIFVYVGWTPVSVQLTSVLPHINCWFSSYLGCTQRLPRLHGATTPTCERLLNLLPPVLLPALIFSHDIPVRALVEIIGNGVPVLVQSEFELFEKGGHDRIRNEILLLAPGTCILSSAFFALIRFFAGRGVLSLRAHA